MWLITLTSFIISFKSLHQHRYVGMFAGYFFYSLPLSMYIAVLVIKFLSINAVICSSDSVTNAVQFKFLFSFVVALEHCSFGQTTQTMVIYLWLVISEFEQQGHKVLQDGGGGGGGIYLS